MFVQWPPLWYWRFACITLWDDLTMVTVGQFLDVDQFLDCISTRFVKQELLHVVVIVFVSFVFCISECSSSVLFCFPLVFFILVFLGIAKGFIKPQQSLKIALLTYCRELRKTLDYNGPRQLGLISFQWIYESELGLWIWTWIFTDGFLRFICYIIRIFLPRMLGHTVNPPTLIGCCDWTPIQLFLQSYFYVLYQYSIQPARWNVVNIGTNWGDIIYDA